MADAVGDALDVYPVADVLSVVSGAFVGLAVALVRESGNDPTKEITIDGLANQRGITIHAAQVKKDQPCP